MGLLLIPYFINIITIVKTGNSVNVAIVSDNVVMMGMTTLSGFNPLLNAC